MYGITAGTVSPELKAVEIVVISMQLKVTVIEEVTVLTPASFKAAM